MFRLILLPFPHIQYHLQIMNLPSFQIITSPILFFFLITLATIPKIMLCNGNAGQTFFDSCFFKEEFHISLNTKIGILVYYHTKY